MSLKGISKANSPITCKQGIKKRSDQETAVTILVRPPGKLTTPLRINWDHAAAEMRSTDAITKARAWGYQNLFWFRGGW